jgi:hypothetical protein
MFGVTKQPGGKLALPTPPAVAAASSNLKAIYLNNKIGATARLGHTRFAFSLDLNPNIFQPLIIT